MFSQDCNQFVSEKPRLAIILAGVHDTINDGREEKVARVDTRQDIDNLHLQDNEIISKVGEEYIEKGGDRF